MKSVTIPLLCLIGGSPLMAIPVFDAAALKQSILNYAALGKQITNQATQITKQVEQIKQMETELSRMGDMAKVKDVKGFSTLKGDLSKESLAKTWEESQKEVDGKGLFEDTRGGTYRPVSETYTDFEGNEIARDEALYLEAHDVAHSVDEFKTVQSDVYSRREDLRRAIAETAAAEQAATTEAEHQKLQAVLNAQYGQLAALNAEVELSAAEVQVKTAEAEAMAKARAQADSEVRTHLSQQEANKVTTTFKPHYDCLLQYVKETSLAK
ncbi:MAG: type IV secretion system protein [Opitutaceae bacterium]|nr:type IV secretion system protein [Opitutaceae bacterium]